uniref:Uncharacterized protein n=1 Tax=Pseudictyota dubia TaxID=2749911 RepID=A0A7R9VKA4_9STRA
MAHLRMARPATRSAGLSSSQQRGRYGHALVAIAWILLSCLTLISVVYSVRIYAALVSDDDDGNGADIASRRGGRIRSSGAVGPRSKRRPGRAQKEDSNEEPNYALLYPNYDCVGEPVRINYSSSEKNCQQCRDFCDLRFKGQETSPNELDSTSIFVFGEKGVQIVNVCAGQFKYERDKITTLKVIRPEEGCINLGRGASHARFV